MNKNKFNPGPGIQPNAQSSQDIRREYEDATDGNSTKDDDYEKPTPQEFPERRQEHNYKDPSDDHIENNEDDDEDTDDEILDKDDEKTAQVDEKSMDIEDRGLV